MEFLKYLMVRDFASGTLSTRGALTPTLGP